MSEERRDQTQEEARRVLSPVRLAVLLLLGALFLVVGGSRADAAGAEPVREQGPELVSGTLEALDVGRAVAPVAASVDRLVDPVLTGTQSVVEPVVRPVVEPVVRPVVEPVVAPLRPVVERVATPLAPLPVTELVAPLAPVTTGSGLSATPAREAVAERTAEVPSRTAATTVEGAGEAAATALQADALADPEAPTTGTPASTTTSKATSDGGTGSPVTYAVLLTAAMAVLLFTGGVAPRRDAAPLAPTFLPPVFPG